MTPQVIAEVVACIRMKDEIENVNSSQVIAVMGFEHFWSYFFPKKKERRNNMFIPICILGMTSVVQGDRITFQHGSSVESIAFKDDRLIYTLGKKRIEIGIDEMDAILIGWYSQFDASMHGFCSIIIQNHDDGIAEIKYSK